MQKFLVLLQLWVILLTLQHKHLKFMILPVNDSRMSGALQGLTLMAGGLASPT